MDVAAALTTFEATNNVQSTSDPALALASYRRELERNDAMYRYDAVAQQAVLYDKPWKNEYAVPHWQRLGCAVYVRQRCVSPCVNTRTVSPWVGSVCRTSSRSRSRPSRSSKWFVGLHDRPHRHGGAGGRAAGRPGGQAGSPPCHPPPRRVLVVHKHAVTR